MVDRVDICVHAITADGFNVTFIHSFFCGSTVLVWMLAALHTEGFLILFRYLVGLLWMSDQPIAKTSMYTERQGQTPMP
jgi:hypothetical protein